MTPLRPGDPRQLGPYRITGRLGGGGQGIVYFAHSPDGTPVAVKVLREHIAEDAGVLALFAEEVQAAKRVSPFCIAQVLDDDLTGDHPYIVTEYVHGPTLQQAVADHGPYGGQDLHRLAVATMTALAAIHEAGVVHRDLKPANVLLGPDGPRVIDFGVARALESTSATASRIVGTPAYMAPEQFSGARIGPAADIFAWAVLMVFANTGRPAFGSDSLPAISYRVLNADPDLGDIADPLRRILLSCLSKDPAARPQAADLLLDLLGRGAAGAVPVVPAEAPAYGAERPAAPVPSSGGAPDPAAGGRRRGYRPLLSALLAGAVAVAVIAGVRLWPPGSTAGGAALAGPRPSAAASENPAPSLLPSSPGETGGRQPGETPTGTAGTRSATSPASVPKPRRTRSAEPEPTRSTEPKPKPTPTSTRSAAPEPTRDVSPDPEPDPGTPPPSAGPGELRNVPDQGGGVYRIINRNSGLCLHVRGGSGDDGARIVQSPCTGGAGQTWSVFGDGAIVNGRSGKCLAMPRSSTDDGALAIQWECLPASRGQKWGFRGKEIVNRNSGKCLALPRSAVEPGVQAIQWECLTASRGQKWRFAPAG
ncbi:serine/threonine protein kinase [Planobispora longispora]|nr:serine/threonine protein kinase [Planobispora longispora]